MGAGTGRHLLNAFMLSHANTGDSKMAAQRPPVKCMDSCVCSVKLKSTDMDQFYRIVNPKAREKSLLKAATATLKEQTRFSLSEDAIIS